MIILNKKELLRARIYIQTQTFYIGGAIIVSQFDLVVDIFEHSFYISSTGESGQVFLLTIPIRDKLGAHLRLISHLLCNLEQTKISIICGSSSNSRSRSINDSVRVLTLGKIEKILHWLTVWQACILVAKLVEIWIQQSFQRSGSFGGIVAEESCDEVDSFSGCTMSENFLPRQGFDLREAVLCVFRIHGEDLFARRRTQDLDDFDELVYTTLTWEDWLTQHELCNDTAH